MVKYEMETVRQQQLRKISLEYDAFEVEDDVELMDTLDYIFACSSELEEYRKDFRMEKTNNINDRKMAKALRKFSSVMGYRPVDFYDSDNELVDVQMMIASQYGEYLERLFESLEEDNCVDVYRLARFTRSKFVSNVTSVDEERDLLEAFFYDDKVCGSREDLVLSDHEAFALFFEVALNKVWSCDTTLPVKVVSDAEKFVKEKK